MLLKAKLDGFDAVQFDVDITSDQVALVIRHGALEDEQLDELQWQTFKQFANGDESGDDESSDDGEDNDESLGESSNEIAARFVVHELNRS